MSELPPLVKALLTPQAYPERPEEIELIQTQMSFVFLAGDYVYKVKKPVDLDYLDYTTLENRRFFCYRELELNRRLCPEVYLDVVRITRDGASISIEGGGETIEYAVKMRRLPAERMMDRLLVEGRVTGEMVREVARRIAEFHQRAETSEEIGRYGVLEVVKKNNDENFEQTERYIGVSISREQYQGLKHYVNDFIGRNTHLFKRRVDEGRIRDCHGDLHAAHVCFSDGICIFDCIEFNERFRYSDVAAEVAFLAMDLDFHRHSELSRCFVDAYVEFSGDRELFELLDFYKCYRAYVRGKVESFKLDDPYISGEEKVGVLARARRYFELAESYMGASEVI